MSTVNLIIDIGSSNVTIYKEGEGIVLREPSIVLIEGDENRYRIVDFGLKAYNRIGQLPENYKILYPVQEGAITYKKATKSMMDYFIKKVVVRSDYFFKPKVRVFLNIPCGSGKEERELFEEVMASCDVSETYQVEAPVFAAFGSNVVITQNPIMFVDIGGGLTDIALVSVDGIEKGVSYGIGGLAIDNGIIEGLESSLSLHVGLMTAENLKIEIGSLYENENSSVTVYGKNTISGNPKSSLVTTKHIRVMLEYYYGKIADVILNFMKDLPEETLKMIYENGILFTGGGSELRGLDTFMKKRIHTPINIPDKCGYCSVMGGAKLLAEPIKMNKILKIM